MKVPKIPDDPDLARLTQEWREWRFWRATRSDGKPGSIYASRIRTLTMAERDEGLLALLPAGFAEDDRQALDHQLVEQAEIQARLSIPSI